jgi:radical SAM-linked protein
MHKLRAEKSGAVRMRIGIEFSKTGMAKYISHLDLQRAFSRAIRRSNLPVKLSQGFNPHYVMSFASALALGIKSECECVEMALSEEVDTKVFLFALSNALPPGIEAKSAVRLAEGAPKLMAAVREAQYSVVFADVDMDMINAAVCDIMSQSEIIATKKAKGKIKQFDMRAMIVSLEVDHDKLVMRLVAAPLGSLKPEFVLAELKKRVGELSASVTRTKLLAHSGGKAIDLLTACS